MDGVSYCSDQDSELVSAVDILLLEAEYDGPEVLVAGEIVPVLSAMEILLIGSLYHAGQLNTK